MLQSFRSLGRRTRIVQKNNVGFGVTTQDAKGLAVGRELKLRNPVRREIRDLAAAGRQRMILLSDRELEPYFVYESAAKEFEIDLTAVSLQDLANTTHSLYFDPKPKNPRA